MNIIKAKKGVKMKFEIEESTIENAKADGKYYIVDEIIEKAKKIVGEGGEVVLVICPENSEKLTTRIISNNEDVESWINEIKNCKKLKFEN